MRWLLRTKMCQRPLVQPLPPLQAQMRWLRLLPLLLRAQMWRRPHLLGLLPPLM